MIINKIDKYLKRFTSNVEYGTRSRYYTLPTGVVRVSDHVGRNSNAVISIIITNKNDYILHKHSSGELSNISYNDLKKLVKSLAEYGSLFSNDGNLHIINELRSDIRNKDIVIKDLKTDNSKLNRFKNNGFMVAFRSFAKLTYNQKLAVCSIYNKTELSELTPEELLSAMGTPMVQGFFKSKKN
jgi:hypothetical protein